MSQIYDKLAEFDITPLPGCVGTGSYEGVEGAAMDDIEVNAQGEIGRVVDLLKQEPDAVAAVDYLGRVWVIRDGVESGMVAKVYTIEHGDPTVGTVPKFEAIRDAVFEAVGELLA